MVDEFKDIVAGSYSRREVFSKLGWKEVGHSYRKFNKLIETHSIPIDHFNPGLSRRKYERETRNCLSCGKEFETVLSKKGNAVTCSKSCAATYFKTGKNNPNWSGGAYSYRDRCFRKWGNACMVCGEDRVVEVHHLDEDRTNNKVSNLRPLCPTHHTYMHRGYGNLIEHKLKLQVSGVHG